MLDKTHFSLLIMIISPDFFWWNRLFLRLAAGDGKCDKRKQDERKDGEMGRCLRMDHILSPLTI